jgi:hypothetical protein
MSGCGFDENGSLGPAMYAQRSRNRHRINTKRRICRARETGDGLPGWASRDGLPGWASRDGLPGWASRDAAPILRLKIRCPLPESPTPCSWDTSIYSLNKINQDARHLILASGAKAETNMINLNHARYARGRIKPLCTLQTLNQDGASLASASCNRRTPESWDCNSAKAVPNASATLRDRGYAKTHHPLVPPPLAILWFTLEPEPHNGDDTTLN